MSTTHLDTRSGTGTWAVAGLVAGLITGVVFLVFEMVVAGIMGPSAFGPARMIGAIGLGEGALPPQPTIGLATVLPVALIIHFINSAVYGAIFGVIAGLVGALRNSRWALIGAATVFGFALWIVNFYIIAPVAFPWFGMANPVVQFIAHTFFFGTVLGLLLASRTQGEEE
ncbi:MAG: hypothetical protein M3157_06170 [Actinomycetota bacterium]|nr:hypothetical protein [Actinomycetota bacterium]